MGWQVANNFGDLTQSLIEGGLAPKAARIIANLLGNLATPVPSTGRNTTDSTPTENLRLVTPDIRKYQLTNLDYASTEPFRQRLDSHPGQYAGPPPDHPYKDSQPVTVAAPLASPRVRAGDYIQVANSAADGSETSEITLKLRTADGRHLRLDPTTKTLDGVPLAALSETGRYLSAEFTEEERGTTLVLSLRNVAPIDVALADGSTARIAAFSETGSAAPFPIAFSQTSEGYEAVLNGGSFSVLPTSPGSGVINIHCDAPGESSRLYLHNAGGQTWTIASTPLTNGINRLQFYAGPELYCEFRDGTNPRFRAGAQQILDGHVGVSQTQAFFCRGYVSFSAVNGNVTILSRSRADVSILRIGEGQFRIQFAQAVGYPAVSVTGWGKGGASNFYNHHFFFTGAGTDIEGTWVTIQSVSDGGTFKDPNLCSVCIFA